VLLFFDASINTDFQFLMNWYGWDQKLNTFITLCLHYWYQSGKWKPEEILETVNSSIILDETRRLCFHIPYGVQEHDSCSYQLPTTVEPRQSPNSLLVMHCEL